MISTEFFVCHPVWCGYLLSQLAHPHLEETLIDVEMDQLHWHETGVLHQQRIDHGTTKSARVAEAAESSSQKRNDLQRRYVVDKDTNVTVKKYRSKTLMKRSFLLSLTIWFYTKATGRKMFCCYQNTSLRKIFLKGCTICLQAMIRFIVMYTQYTTLIHKP